VRHVARLALFPLLVGALAAFALAAPSLDAAGALRLPASANETLLLLLAIGVSYALIAGLERALPFRPDWNRRQGDLRTDALHLLLSGPGAQTAFRATLLGPYVALGGWLSASVGAPLWPAGAPLALQLALALVLGELGHYAFHRLSHEQPLVWRLHAAHHSAPRLYWLNATRFQLLDLFALLACEGLPLAILGIGPEALLSYTVFRAVYGQIQHCNVDLRTPRLVDRILSTPGVHRWHHSTDSREGNHNYGAVLSVWDLLFGSFFRPDVPFAGPVGIGRLPRFPGGYVAQQLSPFRWSRIAAGARAAGP
jgi:sterol desaturase/sphingolipid hydroxylase (fatty acid hydroxylase superfamily)